MWECLDVERHECLAEKMARMNDEDFIRIDCCDGIS